MPGPGNDDEDRASQNDETMTVPKPVQDVQLRASSTSTLQISV